MFNIISNHKRFIQVALVLLIVPPFAFFGLESYTRSFNRADEVARVDGAPVSQREYEEARRAQLDRMRAIFGRNADASTLDTPEAREAVIDALVSQRVAAGAVARAGITVSDDLLREMIQSNTAFHRDGRFDVATYRQLLRAQGMTEQLYEQRLRQEISVGQMVQAISDTAIVSGTASRQLALLEGQRREIVQAMIPAQQFATQVKIDDVQLKAYFEANGARFRVPERVRAEYLVLSAENLGRDQAVSEDELKAAYAARAKQYGVEEQRRASHILVKTRAEAEKLVADVRKAPGRFAELAKRFSQDPGSAESGGDLGFFARGMMVKPFEDAAFKMKAGEVAGPVESEFGFHVIRLDAVQAGHSRSLEEVRKELSEELAKQKGSRHFAEAAEAFSQIVYEQSDSLEPAAKRFKLAIQTTEWLARKGTEAPAPLDHPRVLGALFTQDAITARRNTDAIEVATNVLVSARVVAHEPETQRKFDEVRAEIEQRLRRQEAAKLAHQDGAAKLEQVLKGADAGLKWSPPRVLSVRDAQSLQAAARQAIFAAEASRLPAYVGEERGEEGYAIYRVIRVIPPETRTEAQQSEALANAQRRAGGEQLDAWLASQRSRAKIEINREALERK